MSSDLPCLKYLEAFSFAHVSDGFQEDDGWDMLNSFMNLEGSPLDHVKILQDRGNSLFKQKNFDVAAACYDRACKLLGFALGSLEGYEVKNVCELAVSLNLNLAASAIKLLEYEAAKDLCSLVLSTFPHTVKALFRRAVAFMGLKIFTKAKTDLEMAKLLEPNNKEILRELTVVNNYLVINSNGKRKLEVDFKEDNVNNIGSDPNKNKLVEHSDSCSSNNSCSELRLGGKDNILNEDKTVCPDMKVDSEAERQKVGEQMFSFCKKGDKRPSLRISESTYQKLLDGKEVSFYQNYHLTNMKIRILRPIEFNTQPNAPHKKKKKKKKKRRLRKRKAKAKDTNTTDKVLAPSTLSNNEVCARETTDKKTIINVSVESVETLMVEDNFSVVENEVQQIPDTRFPTENSAAKIRRTFKRLPSSVARVYMRHSGDADPPDIFRPKYLDSSAMTRLRVQRFRHLGVSTIHELRNSHSFTRFPSYRKTNLFFPRSQGVSLYCSGNNLGNAKRKSAENLNFMNLLSSPSKKQCRNHHPNCSFSFSSSFKLNKFVCNYDSESQDTV